MAGFTSGEAYKVGHNKHYIRLQRFFLRQTFDLPGEPQPQDAELNPPAATHSVNHLVFKAAQDQRQRHR